MNRFLLDFLVIFGGLSLCVAIAALIQTRKQNTIQTQLKEGEKTVLSFEAAQRKLDRFKHLSIVYFFLCFAFPLIYIASIRTIVELGYIVPLAIGLGIYMVILFFFWPVFHFSKQHVFNLEKNPVVYVRCDQCGHDTRFTVIRPPYTKKRSLPYTVFLSLLSLDRIHNSNMFVNKRWYLTCEQCKYIGK